MPKMTAKYTAALAAGRAEGLKETGEELYQALAKQTGFWECAPIEDADAPSQFVRLRVWADAEIVEDFAGDIAGALEALGFKLAEKSPAYPCRPPKQLEARVYLTLLPPSKRRP